jgi:transposase
MTLPQDIVGVGIAKDWIDCHWLSTGKTQRLSTAPEMLRRFAVKAAKTAGALVAFEASGGYERPLAGALDAAESYRAIARGPTASTPLEATLLTSPARASSTRARCRPHPSS